MRILLSLVLVALLAACGNKPRQPDWLVNADGAQDRYERAYLSGNDRVATSEFTRFRSEVASTAQPGLVARAELTRCAVQVASLDFAPCTGFERLRQDAPEAERAYADFLAGTATPEQARLLPEQYRGIAGGQGGAAALKGVKEPLPRLVAAGVLLRTEKADPEVLQVAVDTASDQGWRRSVMAWLGAQAMRAEKAGAVEEAAKLRRRMQLASEQK
ncbi:hypothetical protein H8N03_19530 [Ramlibacter sp. USB13]|uniref:Lipoprotein n=1 Tax=Ramlibacter cellulosilyticus TaxID=2764187 RepID=A0A923MUU9_9BURK|nr:hypothetical protein [Ramlibacter cellulosilyticus]MBC5785148.1 hypothetical protein [Ramlibacter cellulosilyticus]